MRNYRTSKDYPKLRRLLDDGYEVVCSIYGGAEPGDVGLAYIDPLPIGDSCYDICETYNTTGLTDDQFVSLCEEMDLEYIEPNKG